LLLEIGLTWLNRRSDDCKFFTDSFADYRCVWDKSGIYWLFLKIP
jgi:hypothetical protein